MPSLFFFTGQNTPTLEDKLNFWKKEFVKKHDESNLEVFEDIDTKQIGTLINSIESQPFLAEKRMIIIKGLPLAANTKKKIETEALEESLTDIPETSLVIFVATKPDKRGKFYKWMAKNAKLESFDLPKGREMQSWVIQRLQKNGMNIDAQAASLLILYCGEDIVRINGELKKLQLLDRESISTADIQKFVSPTPEGKIFQSLDLMGKASRQETLRSFEKLFQTGQDPMMVFFMLVRQVRLLLQMRSLLDRNMPRPALQKKMKLAPFQVGMLSKQAETFRFDQLRKAYSRLSKMDFKIKTGRIPSSSQGEELLQLSIEQFLCSLYE
jgi:DNA polymerase-3 subunit delta